MSENEILTTEEVASHLRISKRTLLREVHEGKIESFRAGKSLRFTRNAVEKYKENQKVNPGEVVEESPVEELV